MTTPIGKIWSDIERAQRLQDFDFRKDIVVSTNLAIEELSRKCDWIGLRAEMDAVYDGTNPVQLPSNLAGVIAVVDEDGLLVKQAETYTHEVSELASMWAYSNVPIAPLMYEKGFSIEEGADAFETDLTLPSGSAGEYIQFGAEHGCYKILDATAKTIEPKYFGPKLSNEWGIIRPESTRAIKFGEAGTYKVTYWRLENPLYKDHQRTCLPSTALGLLIAIHILGFHEKQSNAANDLRRDYEKALSEAMYRNPRYYPPAQAMGGTSALGVSFGRKYS